MNMKIIKYAIILSVISMVMISCDDSITDFGYTGSITGMILDQNNNIVSGDNSNLNLVVYVLGEGEDVPLEIRVNGDGSYTNTHLFPQVYSIWLEGPIVSSPTDQQSVDLTGGTITHDFNVTPLISISTPELVGSPGSNSISINYSLEANSGSEIAERVIYTSTVSYPSQSVGSGAYWETLTTSLPDDSGNVEITDLSSDTRYYIRIAARAEGTNRWNHSDQIEITTP
jgi:hypothetical protein